MTTSNNEIFTSEKTQRTTYDCLCKVVKSVSELPECKITLKIRPKENILADILLDNYQIVEDHEHIPDEIKSKIHELSKEGIAKYREISKLQENNFRFIELKLKHFIEEFNMINCASFVYTPDHRQKLFDTWTFYINNVHILDLSDWLMLLVSKFPEFYKYNNKNSIEQRLNAEWLRANELF